MRTFDVARGGLLLAALGLLLAGCGQNAGPHGSPEANLQHFELQEIGNLYRLFQADKGSPPKGLKDLQPFEVNHPEGYVALQSGRCVAVWGIDVMKAPSADVVLAYQKDVPTSGGLVLMADQSIKKMAADEFRAVAKTK